MFDNIQYGKYIIGLGNPGEKYSNTRHNIGFMIIDRVVSLLQKKRTEQIWQHYENMHIAVIKENGYIKPQTFMNLSGDVFSFLPEELSPKDVLIIVDDVYLPLGRLRFKADGSAGGHNGLSSIETSLASTDYNRLKIGICNEDFTDGELIDFVLTDFSDKETKLLEKVTETAAEAVLSWLNDGLHITQQKYNGINLTDLSKENNGLDEIE